MRYFEESSEGTQRLYGVATILRYIRVLFCCAYTQV